MPTRSHRSELCVILSLGSEDGVPPDEQPLMQFLIEDYGGWLFRTELGGIWASFPAPMLAFRATIAILRDFEDKRAGLHIGNVTFTEDGEPLGNVLSWAKRLESTAEPGTLRISELLRQRLPTEILFATLLSLGEVNLKGLGPKLAVEARPVALAQQAPFKFLDSYQSGDSDIFFGREHEIRSLCETLETSRWLTLFGRSGTGKTSLVMAGVTPKFHQTGKHVLVLRGLSHPLLGLAECCKAESAELTDLTQALLELQAQSKGLLIVFDQFEEFFLRFDPTERSEALRGLTRLLEDSRLDQTRWLFSIREDFLAEMSEFETFLPTFLDQRFRLLNLTREQASLCIVGPCERCGLWVEDGLQEALLEELYRDGIDPPELQIVLDRLTWAREPGSARLTLNSYRLLGGVKQIVVDYLYLVLDQQPDRDVVQRLLQGLVTDLGTKQALPLSQLAQQLDLTTEQTNALLRGLISSRLVRRLPELEMVELAHEYLVEEIQSWADEAEIRARHAMMVLDQEFASWTQLGSLIGPERLGFLSSQFDALAPSPQEKALLLRASLIHDLSPKVWLPYDGYQDLLLTLLDEPWDGVVKRRLIESLFCLTLGDEASDRLLQAVKLFGNPTLLSRLERSPEREFLLAEARRMVTIRFFGPEAMARVPGGPALLGSNLANKADRKSELPAYLHPKIDSEQELASHEIDDFWMDLCLITNGQFAEYQPSHFARFPENEVDHPVVCISLQQARAYASWLGKELPTEPEWEKAARGTDGRLFPWGNTFEATRANSSLDPNRTTNPVRQYPQGRSPYGCFDMAGNVWEWTLSKWAELGPFIAQKGGSTICQPAQLQCSARMDAFPDFVLQWVGFRLKSNRNFGLLS